MPPKGRLQRLPRPLRPLVQVPLDAVRRTRQRLAVATRPLRPERLRATWDWYRNLGRESAQRRRESRLTVAVDIEPLWEPLTGVGWYLYCLLDRLKDRDDVRLRLYGPWMCEWTDPPQVELPAGPALEIVRCPLPKDLSLPPHWLARILRWRQQSLVAADANDVVFLPNYLAPERFARARGALAVTVHDLSFRRVAWAVRESTRSLLESHLEATLARAAIVLTDSETVAREIRESGLAGAAPVVSVLLGSGRLGNRAPSRERVLEVTERSGVRAGAYALHVGTIEPRKNLETVVAAWERWQQTSGPVPPLVLVGKAGWKTEALEVEIARGCREGWLRRPGYVSDDQMAALYAGARFLVFPSLYEGFGFPAVEAMALGTPVIASEIEVFREVLRDAALFVPPLDVDAWVAALGRLHADPTLRETLRAAGRRRASELDWDRTAEETVAAFRRVTSRATAFAPPEGS